MSISIGVYDFFAYTIPGIIYLYVVNEFLHLLKLPYIAINEISNITQVILIAVVAYILGIIFETFAFYYFKILYHKDKHRKEEALDDFNFQYKDIKHNLSANEVSLYWNAIQHKNPQITDMINRTMAQSIMLRNISLGFLMLAILYIFLFVLNGFLANYILVVLISFVFSLLAARRSRTFYLWYYRDIYGFVLNYGADLTEIYPFIKRIEPKKESSQANQEGSENKK